MNYNSKTISLFLVKFLLVFGLLLGLNQYFNGSKHYATYFKAVGNYWFYDFNDGCQVGFTGQSVYDIQMEQTSPQLIETARKQGKKFALVVKAYIQPQIFLYSSLLLISLLLASPISWKRKLIALIPSLALMQIYLIVVLSIIVFQNYQINENLPIITNLNLLIQLLDWLHHTTRNVGLHLLIPVAIWILTSFRGSDFNPLLRPKEPATTY